jgi:hypothetical protein
MEKSKTPARRQDIPDSRPLLERILATPRQLERSSISTSGAWISRAPTSISTPDVLVCN